MPTDWMPDTSGGCINWHVIQGRSFVRGFVGKRRLQGNRESSEEDGWYYRETVRDCELCVVGQMMKCPTIAVYGAAASTLSSCMASVYLKRWSCVSTRFSLLRYTVGCLLNMSISQGLPP